MISALLLPVIRLPGLFSLPIRKTQKLLRISVESGLELMGRLADSALKLVAAPAGFSGFAGTMRKIGERIEQESLETLTDAQRFNLHFEKAVQLVLGTEKSDDNSLTRIFHKFY